MRGALLLPLVALACTFEHAGLETAAMPADGTIDAPPMSPPVDGAPPDAPPPPPSPDADPCPPTYLHAPLGCYRLVSSETSFTEAEIACHADGAHLVVITSVDEDRFLATLTGGRTVWIGLSDRATEGTFLWVTDATPVYTGWAWGEPNNFWGGEDCAEYGAQPESWNDTPCDGPRAYVCEVDGVAPGTSWE